MRTTFTYMERDFLRWMRGRTSVVSSLVMPAAWLIFVGLVLPTQFTDDYLDFITPSILVLTMLNASMQGGSLLMFDKVLGFLPKFLAMPAPRESILSGKILFITMRGMLQSAVIVVMAFLLGAHLADPVLLVEIYVVLALFGVLLSSFTTTVALLLEDHDSYAAFNSFASMPLFFTSTALMPYDVMPAWLNVLAHLNPVSYAIGAIRTFQSGVVPAVTLCCLAIGAAAVFCISSYTFKRATV